MEPLGWPGRRHPCSDGDLLRVRLRCLVFALTLTLALTLMGLAAPTADAADGRPSAVSALASWPLWEAGGQLSLLSAGGATTVRAEAGVARFFLSRHAVELRTGIGHLLSVTSLDLEGGYALHLRWNALLAFARGTVGMRFESVGGGQRTRCTIAAGGGMKLRLGAKLALRLELTYRHLTGAPGVADELALLVGPIVLWR